MAEMRELNSPALYSLKKAAGSKSSRLMAAASTGIFILVCTRAIKSVLVISISIEDRATPTSTKATGSSSPGSPAGMTRSKMSFVK
ncbi:MAG: hypothetical protein BWY65_01606 [Firmicutes bacterium ADurb.Bin373]|nr:MAG: hypothetical protein BWY65_01606 [Firmicutes bacterium ADurb.Bin373]